MTAQACHSRRHSGEPCTSRAVATITVGCVHEHVGEALICQWHIDRLAHGGMQCGRCLHCSEPHTCELSTGSLEYLP